MQWNLINVTVSASEFYLTHLQYIPVAYAAGYVTRIEIGMWHL